MRTVSIRVLLGVAVVLFSAYPVSAVPFPVQSHSFCTESVTFSLVNQVEECPVEDAYLTLCLDATPIQYHWTNRAGGVGVVVWDVSGTAEISVSDSSGVNSEVLTFSVSGTYGWVTRLGPSGLEWNVADPAVGSLTAVSPDYGSFELSMTGGSGQITNGDLILDGDMSFEIAETGDLGVPAGNELEGVGVVVSQPGIVDGTAVSDDGADTDGDGVVDSEDNAMVVANADQADDDRDGLGNVIDRCPNDPMDLCPEPQPTEADPVAVLG